MTKSVNANTIEITCAEVWQQLSDYMEDNLSAAMRERITFHLAHCAHCTAVYDGTRNVVRLLGEDSFMELPADFSNRLFTRLEAALCPG